MADDTQLEGVADTLESPTAIEKLKWADGNLMVFSKGNCKIMPLWKNSPIHQCIAGGNQVQISFSKKALRLLVEHEPAM